MDARSPIFVDTNVLLRATVETAPGHQEARALLPRLWDAGAELWLSRQVLREYAVALTRPQTYSAPVAPAVVVASLRTFQAQFHVADDTAEVTAKLLALLEVVTVGGKQVHDANIVATMQAYSIGQLLTHNVGDFERFSAYITVLSPNELLQQL